ncbi:hypothetical protein FCL47_14405 [Desulfopila sp. IMCC35006]|uniref:hypothetical protein n=1 Tax=Desulfopila sp. IMCC35006 TaxID=2569542 RepID=UPI0010AD0C00|nr:hypothetical protein [Desulfopila sp. IMCC35006]TKB25247.1 hypothetical protein FCL47_14405 [Desulfopila sp. IMCC35006]
MVVSSSTLLRLMARNQTKGDNRKADFYRLAALPHLLGSIGNCSIFHFNCLSSACRYNTLFVVVLSIGRLAIDPPPKQGGMDGGIPRLTSLSFDPAPRSP